MKRSDRGRRQPFFSQDTSHGRVPAQTGMRTALETEAGTDAGPGVANARCRVLIMARESHARNQWMSALSHGGYDVHATSSVEEAARALGATPCDIFIAEWEPPDTDVVALCCEVRLRVQENYTYILLLTGRGETDEALAGIAAGADECISRTAELHEILARVKVARRITTQSQRLQTSLREARCQSLTDALTGARNRRYLSENLPLELQRSQRYAHPLAVLMCDIDQFKSINDSWGHEAGDTLLQALVAHAISGVRDGIDWIARLGGDEFLLVLPETRLNGATLVAERIRRSFASHPTSTAAGPIRTTLSIGVTALETRHELLHTSAEALLRAADRCLYMSKELGKDRSTSIRIGQISAAVLHTPDGSRREIH